MKQLQYVVVFFTVLFYSCAPSTDADVVYFNGRVYTVDSAFSVVSAFAVKEGRIVATGSSEQLENMSAKEFVDLKGAAVYPGFYDAHCHFYGYAVDLQKTWLIGTKSFNDVLDTLIKFKDRRFMGWVFGRGWDQNDWDIKEYPDRSQLDILFPDVPVFLMRIDGHAALVNGKALELAGITKNTKVEGGEIVIKGNELSGLLIDNAVDLVKNIIPVPNVNVLEASLLDAQKNCFEVGLTSVVDAGLDVNTILLIDSLQKAGKLKMRVNAMVSYNPANVKYYQQHGPYKSERLNVRSFKLYADGALGSRGACLLDAYSDLPGHFGFLLSSVDSLKDAARTARAMGFQLNTHCIGDSANHLLLKIYSDVLKGKNNLRWRIEHAQVIHPDDFHLFGDYSVIPSVQPTHATSDMYWAADRIGAERIKSAYAYATLLNQNGFLAAGSDFPVESINPLFGFYAAVVRKDQKDFPAQGYMKENALSRVQALRAMTCWAAYASFEEQERGSLEKGKWADFVILDKDLLSAPEKELFKIKILKTYIGGERVF